MTVTAAQLAEALLRSGHPGVSVSRAERILEDLAEQGIAERVDGAEGWRLTDHGRELAGGLTDAEHGA